MNGWLITGMIEFIVNVYYTPQFVYEIYGNNIIVHIFICALIFILHFLAITDAIM